MREKTVNCWPKFKLIINIYTATTTTLDRFFSSIFFFKLNQSIKMKSIASIFVFFFLSLSVLFTNRSKKRSTKNCWNSQVTMPALVTGAAVLLNLLMMIQVSIKLTCTHTHWLAGWLARLCIQLPSMFVLKKESSWPFFFLYSRDRAGCNKKIYGVLNECSIRLIVMRCWLKTIKVLWIPKGVWTAVETFFLQFCVMPQGLNWEEFIKKIKCHL